MFLEILHVILLSFLDQVEKITCVTKIYLFKKNTGRSITMIHQRKYYVRIFCFFSFFGIKSESDAVKFPLFPMEENGTYDKRIFFSKEDARPLPRYLLGAYLKTSRNMWKMMLMSNVNFFKGGLNPQLVRKGIEHARLDMKAYLEDLMGQDDFFLQGDAQYAQINETILAFMDKETRTSRKWLFQHQVWLHIAYEALVEKDLPAFDRVMNNIFKCLQYWKEVQKKKEDEVRIISSYLETLKKQEETVKTIREHLAHFSSEKEHIGSWNRIGHELEARFYRGNSGEIQIQTRKPIDEKEVSGVGETKDHLLSQEDISFEVLDDKLIQQEIKSTKIKRQELIVWQLLFESRFPILTNDLCLTLMREYMFNPTMLFNHCLSNPNCINLGVISLGNILKVPPDVINHHAELYTPFFEKGLAPLKINGVTYTIDQVKHVKLGLKIIQNIIFPPSKEITDEKET